MGVPLATLLRNFTEFFRICLYYIKKTFTISTAKMPVKLLFPKPAKINSGFARNTTPASVTGILVKSVQWGVSFSQIQEINVAQITPVCKSAQASPTGNWLYDSNTSQSAVAPTDPRNANQPNRCGIFFWLNRPNNSASEYPL